MTVLQASDALMVLGAHSLPMQGLNLERDFYKFKVDGLGLYEDPNFKHLLQRSTWELLKETFTAKQYHYRGSDI